MLTGNCVKEPLATTFGWGTGLVKEQIHFRGMNKEDDGVKKKM